MRTTDFEEIIDIHNNLINSGKVQDFEDALEKSRILFDTAVEPLIKLGDKKWTELESMIADIEIVWQEQGFIMGFVYAMKLKTECNMLL